MLETLESRLLLSNVPTSVVVGTATIGQAPVALTPTVPTTGLIPLSNAPTSVVVGTATIGQAPVALTSTVPTTELIPVTAPGASVSITSLLLLNPKILYHLEIEAPSLIPATPAAPVGSTIALMRHGLSPLPEPVGTIVVVNPTSGNLGEGAITPVVVGTTSGGVVPVASEPVAHDGSSAAATTVSTVSSGATSRAGSTPNNGGGSVGSGAETSSIPDATHVQYEGSLSPGHTYVTVVVPVSTMTQALGFTLDTPSGSDPSAPPELDEVWLVDPDGTTVAQVGPLSNPRTEGPTNAVTLELDHAPAGGSLLVRISAPAGATWPTVSGSANATGTAGGTLPFVMDVQRLESSAISAAAGGLPATSGASIGTLSWTSNTGSTESATGNSVTTDAAAGDAASVVLVNQENPASASGEMMASGASSNPADFSGRIALGPLASRGAAPLGPNLATVMADPAPSVDRHERALLQEIDENDTRTEDGPVARSTRGDGPKEGSPGIDETEPTREPGPSEGNFVAVAGLGALPLKASATPGGKRAADLDALLAALPAASRGESGPTLAADEDLAVDSLLVSLTAPASSSQHDRRTAPDYLTSACILALGMGLTAGPLIPDLLRLIPSRSSRWRPDAATSTGLSDRTASRNRGFGNWLRRRIV
jgi:hypothetical protein